MSSRAELGTFRLLDPFVGWDADSIDGLTGLTDPDGITLAPALLQHDGEAITRALLPARLARGCAPCEWFMVTRAPPASRLLRLDVCTPEWRPVWHTDRATEGLRAAVAIATHCDRIAVADVTAGRVWLWRDGGRCLLLAIPIAQPGPIAWAPWGEWLIADRRALRMRRFDPSGRECGEAVPVPGTAERLGVDRQCRVWLVTREPQHHQRLWHWQRGEPRFLAQTMHALHAAFPDTRVRSVGAHRFCFEDSAGGSEKRRCFDWHGRAATAPAAQAPRFARQGQLLTLALDSGRPRTRWHRVRAEAAVPPGTDLAIAVSTHEEAAPPAQGASDDAEWAAFPAGVPHPADWQAGPHASLDFAVAQPPGRYLFVRVRMQGDGLHTPVLRRIRLDFPRRTSLDSLPAVYRDDPHAQGFTERFLAIFDSAIEDIDRAIERHPALLDVEAAPAELLPWLGGLLDVAMDPSWSTERRRAVLRAVPELYRRRGTPDGLKRTLQLLFDREPALDEVALSRPWGEVGHARVNRVRLFGRSHARLRLGSSALASAPIWSVGDPAQDALSAGAFTFRVLMPNLADEEMREQIARVVEAQKPAHAVAFVHGGGSGFVVGQPVHVGVDTALVGLPAPVLGHARSGVRLNRNAVLWRSRRCAQPGLQVGRGSAIGINTVAE